MRDRAEGKVSSQSVDGDSLASVEGDTAIADCTVHRPGKTANMLIKCHISSRYNELYAEATVGLNLFYYETYLLSAASFHSLPPPVQHLGGTTDSLDTQMLFLQLCVYKEMCDSFGIQQVKSF